VSFAIGAKAQKDVEPEWDLGKTMSTLACLRLPIRGILALLLCWLGVSCKGPDRDAGRVTRPEFRRGDIVVVEPTAGTFFEGRVLAASSDRLRVQTLPSRDTVAVAPDDAYRVSSAAAVVHVSDYAVCRTSPQRWLSCRVVERAGNRVSVSDPNGERYAVTAADVLVPTPVTRMNVARRFERTRRRAEFNRAVLRAGAPRAPPGWQPEAREKVIVRAENAWRTARAERALDGGVVITEPGAQTTETVESRRVVPLPPYAHTFQKGQFALLAPTVPVEPWRPVRVLEVTGDQLVVEDEGGRTDRVRQRELVPLQ
jgi:hypothetical protein